MFSNNRYHLPVLAYRAAEIATTVLTHHRRILLHGPPGVGKSTLAAQLAHELNKAGQSCYGICADPGSPAFGFPGAVSLARWQSDDWQICSYEAICSLNAGRFRLTEHVDDIGAIGDCVFERGDCLSGERAA